LWNKKTGGSQTNHFSLRLSSKQNSTQLNSTQATMILASSCLLAFLAPSFAANVRSNVAPASSLSSPLGSSQFHEDIAKAVLTQPGFTMPFENSERLKNLRLVGKGENPINPSATSSFFTYSTRNDLSCDTSKPTTITWGYPTETCLTASSTSTNVDYTSFAYRCNTSKFVHSSSSSSSSLSSAGYYYLTYTSSDCTGTATTYDYNTFFSCASGNGPLDITFTLRFLTDHSLLLLPARFYDEWI
jgi:hypothetical protein